MHKWRNRNETRTRNTHFFRFGVEFNALCGRSKEMGTAIHSIMDLL